jgi:hypothetical protein
MIELGWSAGRSAIRVSLMCSSGTLGTPRGPFQEPEKRRSEFGGQCVPAIRTHHVQLSLAVRCGRSHKIGSAEAGSGQRN